jgi:hypothetical protein
MTRRKPHTVEDRTEKFNQREARRARRGISDDNPEWNRLNAEAEQREQDAELAAEATIPGEKQGE